MTLIKVRLSGDKDAVRQLVDALERATDCGPTSYLPVDEGTSAYLTLTVPNEPMTLSEELPSLGLRKPAQRRDEQRRVAELQARPGEWAAVAYYPSRDSARQVASMIRTGKRACYQPPGAYEAAHRPIVGSPGEYHVYARYVGGESK